MIGKNQNAKRNLLTVLLIMGLLAGLVGEVKLASAQTAPVANDDTYGYVLNGTKTVDAPGVLGNDTYTEPIVSLSVTIAPTHATTFTFGTDGSFSYTRDGYVGNDNFTYTLCDSSGFCDTAVVALVSTDPIWACTEDADGSNDYTGQQDMTQMCNDVNPVNADSFGIVIAWDEQDGPGGNKYFSCALFDTNTNGNVDTATCVQVIGNGSSLLFSSSFTYTCGDNKTDRCTQPLVETQNDSLCSAAQVDSGLFMDPFMGPIAYPDPDPNQGKAGYRGDDYPYDTVATCSIPNTLVGGANAVLINTCSYTSDSSPNSNPFDCIAPTAGKNAFITVIKQADPNQGTFGITTTSLAGYSNPDTFVGTSADTYVVEPGTYSVTETTIPTGWALASSSCTKNGTLLTTGTPPVPYTTGIVVASNDNIVCTFNNVANIDLSVDKTDYDYENGYAVRGGTVDYMITVTNEDMLIDRPARGVVVTDVLDINVSADVDPSTDGVQFTPVVTRTPASSEPYSCSVTGADSFGFGGTIICNLGIMAIGEVVTIEFTVTLDMDTPIGNGIEYGLCTQNPNMQETSGVDVCNTVSVFSPDETGDQTNNSDSDPKDVGKPTAVTLFAFTATGEIGGIRLDWETSAETDNAGFNLYRAASLKGPRTQINDELIPGMPGGMGDVYFYVDEVKSKNTFFYWIESVDIYGYAEVSDMVASAKVLKK